MVVVVATIEVEVIVIVAMVVMVVEVVITVLKVVLVMLMVSECCYELFIYFRLQIYGNGFHECTFFSLKKAMGNFFLLQDKCVQAH